MRKSVFEKMFNVLNDDSVIFFGAAEIVVYDSESVGLDRVKYNNNLYYRKNNKARNINVN